MNKKKCEARTEVYSRIVGYFRPIENWNTGKKEEYTDRVAFEISASSGKILDAHDLEVRRFDP